MEFAPLEPQQRQTFDDDGFLVVRQMLSPDAVAKLNESCDVLSRAFMGKPPLQNKPEYNHLDLRPGLLREQPLFDLVAGSRAVSMIVQILGPNIHLHSTALICKRPENPDAPPFRRGWHRDIRMPKDIGQQVMPRVGVKVCYCLTDFDSAASGMTLLVRGSHKTNGPLLLKKGGVDPVDGELCDLTLKAGDAFLFDNRLFHTATPNLSDRTSRVLMYGYAYRWMQPEVYLTVSQEQLATADPITYQLLGGYRDVDTPPWALQRWAKKHGVGREESPWTVEQ